MTQIIETKFNNPALPIGLSLTEQIKALPYLRSWWQVNSEKVTLVSGAISQIDPKAGGSGAYLNNGTADARPTFDVDGVGVYPSAAFDGVNDQLVASAIPYVQTGDFSWIFMGSVSAMAADQHLASLWSSGANGTRMRVTPAAQATFAHGSGFASAGTVVWDQPNLIIGSSSSGTIRAYCNGQESSPIASDNNNSAATLRLGVANAGAVQPATMGMSDFLIFQTDVLVQPTWMTIFEAYGKQFYNVPIN